MKLEAKLPRTAEFDSLVDQSGISGWDYDALWERYRVPLGKGDVAAKHDFLRTLVKAAHDERVS